MNFSCVALKRAMRATISSRSEAALSRSVMLIPFDSLLLHIGERDWGVNTDTALQDCGEVRARVLLEGSRFAVDKRAALLVALTPSR